MNCSSEPDETLAFISFQTEKLCQWLLSLLMKASISFFREVFLHWNVLCSLGLSLIACPPCLHRLSWKSVNEFSTSNSRFSELAWSRKDLQLCLLVMSTWNPLVLHHSFGLTLKQNTSSIHFSVAVIFLSLSLRKHKSHSSAWQLFCSHCPWHSVFPSLQWLFIKVIRVTVQVSLNASSHWRRESSMPQAERLLCLIAAAFDYSLCNQPLPAQQQEHEPVLYPGLREKEDSWGFSFIAGAAVGWLLLPNNFCQPGSIATRAEQNNFTAGSREGLPTSTTRKHLIHLLSSIKGQQYDYCGESSSLSWRWSWKETLWETNPFEENKLSLFSNWSFVQIVHGVGG